MTAELVWLFDVDGTLILTDGAAREAFADSLESVSGIRDDLDGIPFGGRTDPLILADILARHALVLDETARQRFWTLAYARMSELLVPGRGRVLPGVERVLDRVAAEPAWVPALLTGNNAEMARIKLAHFGLDQRFAFGAFGDEAPNRDRLAQVAVARAEERHRVGARGCIVIGDTEHDISCARAAGAWAVAVATGTRRLHELAAHAPDLALEDLQDADALIDWARGLATR